jgi:hypothetical protein
MVSWYIGIYISYSWIWENTKRSVKVVVIIGDCDYKGRIGIKSQRRTLSIRAREIT